jgi:hypothetical protein
MSPLEQANSSSTIAARIEGAAKTYSNIRTLVVAVVAAIGAIFAAGAYYNELRSTLQDYTKRIGQLEGAVAQSKNDLKDQATAFEAEKKQIRADVNAALAGLPDIQNSGPPFTNTEPASNGGGASAAQPPGRCQVGQVVVGVQPYKEGNGTRSIIMQCGTMPKVQLK